ncbi:MAG: S8 family serine peptidase, partial [Prevotellaceae bacterium]|nr:S8 family serine peptidase [Prevotellaceae bacterium]
MKTLLFFFLVALHATVCLAQPKAGVVSGRLIVKFKPAAYEQAVQTRPAMRTQGVTAAKTLTIGLAGIDKLNEQHKAVSMYRLFPYAGKHEAMQQKFDLHLWYAVVLDESFDPREVAGKYIADNDIEWAEPMPVIRNVNDELTFDGANPVAPTAAFPNDPHYGKQWHYENTGQTGGVAGMDIRLPQAWNITKGNPQVVVGIVDSGVDVTHDDLKGSLWVNEAERDGTSGVDDDNNGYIDDIHGFNFTSGFGFNPNQQPYGPAPIVASEHGSHVAGTIAATTNNATGVAGIAGGDGVNRGARLMVCQTMTDEVKSGHITAAIAYAANNGAAIIQNSWSIGEPSTSIRKAIQYFIAAAGTDGRGNALPGTPMKGGIAIFAAGNDNISLKGYPASYEEVLAVAATNHYGRRSYYSNYGDWVDISAPGGDVQEKTAGGVYSTLPGNRYDYFQGTSMACPHVSGVAALVLSCFGSETYTPDLLRDQLLVTAMPLLDDPQYQSGQMGSGLINAFKAVSEFVPVTGITLPANHSVQVGRTDTIYATILPADATNQRIQWTSSSPGIAAINEAKGIVTGVVEGAATITATTRDGGFAATTTVNVLPVLADSIRLAPQRLIVNQDATTGVGIVFYPFDVTHKELEWRSNDETIALVDDNGQITGMKLDSTYVVATIKNTTVKDSCLAVVVQPVKGVNILPAGVIRLVKGDATTLHAEIIPADAHNKTVFWNSSNTKAVTVKDNLLTAKAPGEASVTVRTEDGNHTAEVRVTVYEAEHAPQGFSPNGDGVNDYFVCALDNRDTYTLTVFDRSGQVHYRSSNYQNN